MSTEDQSSKDEKEGGKQSNQGMNSPYTWQEEKTKRVVEKEITDDGEQPKKRSRLSNEIEARRTDDNSLFRFQTINQNQKPLINKKNKNEEKPKAELSHARGMNISTQQWIALNSTLTKSNELDFIADYNTVQDRKKEALSSSISSRTQTSTLSNPDKPVIYPIPSKLKPHDSNEGDSTNQGEIAVSPINPYINLSSFISNYTQNLQANFTLPLLTNQHAINTFPATGDRLMAMPDPQGINQYQQVMMRNISNQPQSNIPLMVSNQASILANPQQQLQTTKMAIRTQSEDVRNTACIRGPLLYISTDDEVLSDYQILLRKQMEFFEASFNDVGKTSCGRRRPIMMNQVGIRCRHCRALPIENRKNGTIYYPSKLTSIYQAAQNMAITHLLGNCYLIDKNIKKQLQTYQEGPSITGHGGKKYWAKTAKAQGIKESNEGYLQFRDASNNG